MWSCYSLQYLFLFHPLHALSNITSLQFFTFHISQALSPSQLVLLMLRCSWQNVSSQNAGLPTTCHLVLSITRHLLLTTDTTNTSWPTCKVKGVGALALWNAVWSVTRMHAKELCNLRHCFLQGAHGRQSKGVLQFIGGTQLLPPSCKVASCCSLHMVCNSDLHVFQLWNNEKFLKSDSCQFHVILSKMFLMYT